MANAVPLTVCGNLTADPELKFGPNGTAVARFTVVFNSRQLDRDTQEWKDGEPSFYQCTAFGDLAQHIAESLSKGDRVIASGTWRQRHWEEDGQKKSTWQLLVDELGPALRYATATVKKATRSRHDAPPDDEWASASRTRPAPAGAAF